MRYLRQLCLTAALITAFTFSAYAGAIECPPVVDPPPQPPSETTVTLQPIVEAITLAVLSLA